MFLYKEKTELVYLRTLSKFLLLLKSILKELNCLFNKLSFNVSYSYA